MKSSENEFSRVIRPFTRQFGWSICVHDYSGKIAVFSDFESNFHSFPSCAHVKKSGYLPDCLKFDMEKTQGCLLQSSGPFFKICHAGIIECVVPIKIFGSVAGAMFVGQFRWDSKYPMPDFLRANTPYGKASKLLPRGLYEQLIPLSSKKLNDVIEISNTIASRLELILQGSEHDNETTDIKWRIKKFFSENFSKELSLKNLAKHIWLSESRTSHILKKYFGKTFPELINYYKLEHAKSLLRYTGLSIREIAWQSGFKDPGYLHRTFKKYEKQTPCEYRLHYAEEEHELHISPK